MRIQSPAPQALPWAFLPRLFHVQLLQKKKDARSFPKHANALVVTQGSKHRKSQWFSWQRHSVPASRSHKAQWTKRGHQIYKSTWRKQTGGGRKEGEKKTHGPINFHFTFHASEQTTRMWFDQRETKGSELSAYGRNKAFVFGLRRKAIPSYWKWRNNSTRSGWR